VKGRYHSSDPLSGASHFKIPEMISSDFTSSRSGVVMDRFAGVALTYRGYFHRFGVKHAVIPALGMHTPAVQGGFHPGNEPFLRLLFVMGILN